MNNFTDSKKDYTRSDYKPCTNICYICKKTGKKKSKKFKTLYGLKHHLYTHTREDEIIAGVTTKKILHTARAISQALEWNMLLEIPKRCSN